MAITCLLYIVFLLSGLCVVAMLYKLSQKESTKLRPLEYLKLSISGFIAFISDTLGMGSFAVNVALAKLFNTFADDELPAVNNGAQVIPGVIESVFFISLVEVDITTLLTLVIGTCIGGVIGGAIVSQLSKQVIRLFMVCCFFVLILLSLANKFQLMPIGGDALALSGWKLGIGFIAMIFCGGLTSAGIGLFAMVQAVLFLLGVSPAVAFPIMTTAGAMQQPLTTLVFLQQDKIPLKRTLILSIAGCFGVFFALSIFTQLTTTWLHTLLLVVLIYNFYAMSKAYLRERQQGLGQASGGLAMAD